MSGKEDILQYLRRLREQGYDCRRTGNDHYKITFEGCFVTTAPSTPKGGHSRALANLKAEVRRFNRTNHIHPKNRHTVPRKGQSLGSPRMRTVSSASCAFGHGRKLDPGGGRDVPQG
jgi:hypothetical protein